MLPNLNKTLFVSDMDGTLLLPDKTVGSYTRNTLNRLKDKGLLFSVATARSIATVGQMLEGCDITAPVILLNGTVIFDRASGDYLDAQYFPKEQAELLLEKCEKCSRNVFVLTLPHLKQAEDNAIVCYYRSLDTRFEKEFYDERKPQSRYKRFECLASYSEVPADRVIYFSMTGPEAEMRSLQAEVEAVCDLTTALYVDRYDESSYFLEFAPITASKKLAVQKLMQLTGAERLVTFGDNTNDLGMFSVSDACYAVANAIPETIAAATAVIRSNEQEGVARYLEEAFCF